MEQEWEQSKNKNLKVGQEWKQLGSKREQEPKSGTRMETKWEQSEHMSLQAEQDWKQSWNKV